MDNFKIDVVSEGAADLALAMQLAVGERKVVGYAILPKKGMVLFWAHRPAADKEYRSLPFEMDWQKATDFARNWLGSASVREWDGAEPDHDGDNGKGFHLYNEDWGHVAGMWGAIVAVKPAWAMYGK